MSRNIPVIFVFDSDLISNFDVNLRLHRAQYSYVLKCFQTIDEVQQVKEKNFDYNSNSPDILLINPDMKGINIDDMIVALIEARNSGLQTLCYFISKLVSTNLTERARESKIISGVISKPISEVEILAITSMHALKFKKE